MAEWHLITGEYPPQVGGVSDYTHLVAAGLAAAGDEVHVWCPPARGAAPQASGVRVHRELGCLSPADLARVGRMLDRFPAPRRLLLQWVPHSYGFRSLNVPFCAWLRQRAAVHGDRVEIMVHEPSLGFSARSLKHNAAALVHRLMTVLLLRAAHRVWVAAPEWEARWRPYALGRRVPFAWLPIPSNVPVLGDAAGIAALREALLPRGGVVLGHFGTYGRDIAGVLEAVLPSVLSRAPECVGVLIGRGGEAFRDRLLARHPELEGRVYATGGMPPEGTSRHLSACDLLIQPYPEGVNARRGSIMAGLSHALPVVTTTGAVTEPFWKESRAVSLAAAGDLSAMIRRIEALIADPSERERLGVAAGELYGRTFDVSHSVETLRRTAV